MTLYLIILLYFSSQRILPLEATECMLVRDKYDKAAMMSRNVIAGKDNRWPNGTIPYSFGNNFTQLEKAMIYLSMEHIQNNSGVQFIPRLTHHQTFVNLTNDDNGCYVAGAGYHAQRGAQKMNLMRYGCMRIYIIVHEFLHVLGFLHEQSRPDRDDYLNIFWDNIVQSPLYYYQFARAKSPNEDIPLCNLTVLAPFDKCYNGYTATTFGLPYDYVSVMQYPSVAFTRNGNATMLPKNYTGPMGAVFGNGLTYLDVKKLQMAYPKSCISTSGHPCIFPFVYEGQKYSRCTTKNNEGTPWCAVSSLNDKGEATYFANCPKDCPVYEEPKAMPTAVPPTCLTTAGFLCTFPFTYRGVKYDKCTEMDFPGQPWCATETNNGAYNGHYGVCGKDC